MQHFSLFMYVLRLMCPVVPKASCVAPVRHERAMGARHAQIGVHESAMWRGRQGTERGGSASSIMGGGTCDGAEDLQACTQPAAVVCVAPNSGTQALLQGHIAFPSQMAHGTRDVGSALNRYRPGAGGL